MSRNRIDRTPFELRISDLGHDGRGVARREGGEHAGKAIFVSGALPGERVRVEQTGRSRHFDEARVLEVLEASPDRVTPPCPHFGTCSGCVLHHLEGGAQIALKQKVLMENLARIGHVAPREVLAPLTGKAWGYRRKGRFSVKRVEKKDKTLVGFRETDPRFVADLRECRTVVPALGTKVAALSELVDSLDGRADIPQIEFIAGDQGVALVFRHLNPLSDKDRAALAAFAAEHGFIIFLQPGGVTSVHPLHEPSPELSFALPQWNAELAFRPLDFIQVNGDLNQKMIAHALELLNAQADDHVLDLFCGLGNFTLPLARVAGRVTGVEGDAGLVQRARENAQRNGLANTDFHAADLSVELRGQPWLKQPYTKLLLDPPRSGAIEVLKQLPLDNLQRIVYVSCHPGSLARDAGWLVNEAGWTLQSAGAMDMFPQTAHVESIALFLPPRRGKRPVVAAADPSPRA